jgi:hypothetical protein
MTNRGCEGLDWNDGFTSYFNWIKSSDESTQWESYVYMFLS